MAAERKSEPAGMVAQLDANIELLAALPGAAGAARVPTLGVVGEHAGEMAVLVYRLLKGTGRRVGEVVSLPSSPGSLEVPHHRAGATVAAAPPAQERGWLQP